MMSLQKFIVSKDDSIYEAWPDLVQTDSGKLICVFPNVNTIVTEKMQGLCFVKAMTAAEPGQAKSLLLKNARLMITSIAHEFQSSMTADWQSFVTE